MGKKKTKKQLVYNIQYILKANPKRGKVVSVRYSREIGYTVELNSSTPSKKEKWKKRDVTINLYAYHELR